MGQRLSKKNKHKGHTECDNFHGRKQHCCYVECLPSIPKAYEMVDVVHLGWLFTAKHEQELESFFKRNNIQIDLIQIIVLYLPSYNHKHNKRLSTKAYQNMEQHKNEEYHCYFHVYISSLYNNREPPCLKWLDQICEEVEVDNYANSDIYKSCKLPAKVPMFRMTVIGAGAVGKSALTIRYIANEFQNEYDPTIEASYTRLLELNPMDKDIDAYRCQDYDQDKYKYISMHVVDTAGKEQFAALQHHWIRESQIFLLCFAINAERTFEHVANIRKVILRNLGEDRDEKFAMILVGTKGDLRHDPKYKANSNESYWGSYGKIIEVDKILKVAKMWNLPYIETSSKIGRNVNFLFRQCIYECWIQSNHYEHPSWEKATDLQL